MSEKPKEEVKPRSSAFTVIELLVSDERNNVHWLKALTPTAFTFDVLVLGLNGKSSDVDNIDPNGAEKVSGGLLRARKLTVDEALRKYGHDSHHSTVRS
jgi:hypothetical protein